MIKSLTVSVMIIPLTSNKKPTCMNLKEFDHPPPFHAKLSGLKLLFLWCLQVLQLLIHLQSTKQLRFRYLATEF